MMEFDPKTVSFSNQYQVAIYVMLNMLSKKYINLALTG